MESRIQRLWRPWAQGLQRFWRVWRLFSLSRKKTEKAIAKPMNIAAEPARESEGEIEVELQQFSLTLVMTKGQARDLMNQLAMKLHEQ